MPEQQTLTDILTACAGAIYSNTPRPMPDGSIDYVLGDEVQLPCPCLNYPFADFRTCGACLQTGGYEPHGTSCTNCQGRTWVPNPDQDAWRRVIRALYGAVLHDSCFDRVGDDITIILRDNLDIGHVDHTEGLRDFLAFATALQRALEQMPNVEMG